MSEIKFIKSNGPQSILNIDLLATISSDGEVDVNINLMDQPEDKVYKITNNDVETIEEFGTITDLMEYLSDFEISKITDLEYAERYYVDGIKFDKRDTVSASLKSPLHKEHDFIEVTRWTNHEGFDVTISDKTRFSLQDSEVDVLYLLVNKLRNQ